MASVRAFSGTLIVFVVATGVLWLNRSWLLDFWLSPLFEVAARDGVSLSFPDRAGLAVVMAKITVAGAVLVTFPSFSVEAWLVFCRMTQREEARRLALPFGVVAAGTAAVVLWLARQVPLSVFLEPL